MSYNNSAFSLFAFTSSATEIIADQSNPTFSPPAATTFTDTHAFIVTQTIAPAGGAVTNATALRVDSPSGATNNYSMLLTESLPVGFGGTSSESYFFVGATVSDTGLTSMIENTGAYVVASSIDPNGILEATAFNPPAATIYGTATGLQINPTRGGAGAITSLAGLIVAQPTGGAAATVSNVCAEFKGLTYHEQGITFGVPGVGGYPNTGDDILQFYIENENWTPTISGSTAAGVGTYTGQIGYYHRIGALIFIDATVAWTAHTGTGNILFTNLPFTVRNLTNYAPTCIANLINITIPNRTTVAEFAPNTRQAAFTTSRTNNTNLPVPFDTAGEARVSAMYLTA